MNNKIITFPEMLFLELVYQPHLLLISLSREYFFLFLPLDSHIYFLRLKIVHLEIKVNPFIFYEGVEISLKHKLYTRRAYIKCGPSGHSLKDGI